MSTINQLDRFHKTRPGLLIFGLAELALAYWFVSLALDRGNLWYYLLTLILLVGALQNIFRFIGTFLKNGKRR